MQLSTEGDSATAMGEHSIVAGGNVTVNYYK